MRKRRIVGSVIVNPRPKRRIIKRKATRRRKATAAARRVRTNPPRKVTHAKRKATRRRVRRNPPIRTLRRHPGFRRPARRPVPRRRPLLRRPPLRRPLLRRRMLRGMPRRGRFGMIRRNPGSLVSGAQGMLRKIPFLGGFLANVVGFLPGSVLGAISVEPVSMLAQLASRWPMLSQVNASLFYALAGMGLAVVVGYLPFIPQGIRKNLQIAMASASGGVAYYMWRSASMGGGANSAPQLEEVADDAAGGGISGLLNLGEPGVMISEYGDPQFAASVLGDVFYSGDDLSYGEIQTALAGPRAWRRKYAARRPARPLVQRRPGYPEPSPSAGVEGTQWDWMISLLGWNDFQALAALSDRERKAAIMEAKQAATNAIRQHLGGGGYGAVHQMGAVLTA